jgi:hypothetical protein
MLLGCQMFRETLLQKYCTFTRNTFVSTNAIKLPDETMLNSLHKEVIERASDVFSNKMGAKLFYHQSQKKSSLLFVSHTFSSSISNISHRERKDIEGAINLCKNAVSFCSGVLNILITTKIWRIQTFQNWENLI